MAFQTGSQINPALGRVDYTPYMQGAVAGAQSIGQGIASLGQSIGSGMEAYAKRKKENKMMEASLKANINSLEGLSKIASSLSPQAQEQFNSTMQQLNDPSIPLTEKVALSEAAQKTVGELINFGMQEKQKQEQATIQQLGYDAAISGQPIPLIYPQSVRAPAAIQSLAIQGQLANIAETKAKAKAAGAVEGYSLTDAALLGEKMREAAGRGMVARLKALPNGSFLPEIISEPKAPITNINTEIDTASKIIGEEAGRIFNSFEAQAEAANKSGQTYNTLKTLYDQGAFSGTLATPLSTIQNLMAGLGFNVDKAASQAQLEAALETGVLETTKALYGGMGALSNLEGSKGERTVANLSRTPEGNLRIAAWNSANAPVLEEAVALRNKLYGEKVAPLEINRRVKKYIKDNYISLEQFTKKRIEDLPAAVVAVDDL